MRVSFSKMETFRAVGAGLAIAMVFAAGCKQDEGAPSSAPTNPVPRADLPRPVQPPPKSDQGGEMKEASNVEKDLRKDLAAPVIKPDAAPATPPAAKTDHP